MAPDQNSKSLRPLKITGEKFTITIPKTWRDSHKLSSGDSLIPFYVEGSVLILNPKGREISGIEADLINLLIEYPKMSRGKELAQRLVEVGQEILNSF